MELSNIRAFVAVVREGGFSAAGRALHLTQPSVSARIARLEETLGERLLERSAGMVRLTPAGEHLLPRAESLLLASDDMARSVRDLRGLKRGALNLGVTDLASIYVLPRPFRRFHRAYPEVELSVTVEGTAPLLDALRAGRTEIAVANLPAEGDDLDVTEVDRDRLALLLPHRHPLAGRKRIRPTELAGTPMITFKPESITRREVSHAFAAAGIEPRVAMEISSPEAIKKLVEVGLGFAILPERSVRAELREGRLASPSIAGIRLERSIGLIRISGRYLSPAAKAFASMVTGGR